MQHVRTCQTGASLGSSSDATHAAQLLRPKPPPPVPHVPASKRELDDRGKKVPRQRRVKRSPSPESPPHSDNEWADDAELAAAMQASLQPLEFVAQDNIPVDEFAAAPGEPGAYVMKEETCYYEAPHTPPDSGSDMEADTEPTSEEEPERDDLAPEVNPDDAHGQADAWRPRTDVRRNPMLDSVFF